MDLISSLSQACTVVMIFMCVAGIIGNILSLIIYTKPAFRRRSINILLSALSASDLCVCCLAIPVFNIGHLQSLLPGSQKITALIMVYLYPITVMFQSMSVWLLVSITIDRYLAVCHPFVVRTYCTRSRALLTVFVIVIFSVAYNFVRFWEFQFVDKETDTVEEMVQPLLRDNVKFMLYYQNIATLLSQFVVPVVALCMLNIEVARTILKAIEQRNELVASERREHSTAKMMIFVVLVFLFCYTFSFILNILEIFQSSLFRSNIGYLLNDVNNILVVVNSSSTFIFYVKYSTRYRNQLRTLYGIRWFSARLKFKDRHRKKDSLTAKQYTAGTPIAKSSCYSDMQGSFVGPADRMIASQVSS